MFQSLDSMMEEVSILAQKAKIDSEEVTAAELKYEIRKIGK